uniref:Centrosomal protein 43 n=1 Tax=Dicentrarchus labrax TaxID=13489 RepID=A0A8P4GI30_DICLA
MSATEDDTELRDLLIQNLENNGVLNKLKAEMRAAVFLAMEEQDRLENKSPLVNENLKKCLNTKDGRLVASLIMDFLQVFNLDFTLAVFQPEINSLNGLDSRDLVCRDLGLSESEVNRNSPLLLELVRRGRHKATEVRLTDYQPISCQSCNSSSGHQVLPSLCIRLTPADRIPLEINETMESERASSLGKGDFQQPVSRADGASDNRTSSSGLKKDRLDLDLEDDPDEGDSFFDDPLPKPQKTYDDDVEYDDDFNSHRSDLSKSELSIGEEIEEVSIEGPDNSDKLDETTQDLSVSQLSQSHGVDYMEEVA